MDSKPDTDTASSTAHRRQRGFRLRWLYPLWWWLAAVWIVDPERPTPLFRTGVLATWAVALVACAANRRGQLDGVLQPALRLLDRMTFSSLLLLALGEGTLRILAACTDSPLLVAADANAADRVRHQRYRAHGMHCGRPCNALGFVDEEFALQRTPGLRRIVALGDSFAVGIVRYEQNFLTLVDAGLDITGPTEILNFGVIGIGPAEYLELWRTEASRYQPDVVLLCIYVGNDFVRRRASSLLHRESCATLTVAVRLWQVFTHAAVAGEGPDLGIVNQESPTLTEAEYATVLQQHVRVFAREPDSETRLAIADTLGLLDEIAAAVGPRLRVVLIPDELQIDEGIWQRLVASGGALDRQAPGRLLREFFAARRVPCLDLYDALATAAATGSVYVPRDMHWNARGNAAAAAAIVAWLAKG